MRPRVIHWPVSFAMLLSFMLAHAALAEAIDTEGCKWVSPTWGYSTPKLLYDGKQLYAVGLVGAGTDDCVARVYWRDGSGWHRGADLSPVYQPATMVLDSLGRIYVFTTSRFTRGY